MPAGNILGQRAFRQRDINADGRDNAVFKQDGSVFNRLSGQRMNGSAHQGYRLGLTGCRGGLGQRGHRTETRKQQR